MIKKADVKRLYPAEMNDGSVVVYLETSQGDFCLAVPSWHREVSGLISYPAISNHREDWLMQCGFRVPLINDYSRELKERLREILDENEDEIQNRLESEEGLNDEQFWNNLWRN